MLEKDLILETPRLRLRPFGANDLDIMEENLSSLEVMRYISGRAFNANEINDRFGFYQRRSPCRRMGVWLVQDKSSQEKLGTAILLPMPKDRDAIDWDGLMEADFETTPRVETGYIFRQMAWGKGYATEVCSRLVDFAFSATPLEKVWAATDERNLASQNVLRKSGLQDMGMTKCYAVMLPTFMITKDDWQSAKQA